MGSSDSDNQMQFAAEAVWCDIDTRRFYCDLPDLQVFLPTSYDPSKSKQPIEETVTEEVLDAEIPEEQLEDDGNYLK